MLMVTLEGVKFHGKGEMGNNEILYPRNSQNRELSFPLMQFSITEKKTKV